uniref:Uncharacterized protein n=1 Tax=Avena sativa TaxID=4498 RepID=A0ACD5UU55_AVESA
MSLIVNYEAELKESALSIKLKYIMSLAAKSARLRQAKEEAEREIAEYRAQMEAEFQKKLAETSGDSGANVKRLEQETNEKIEQLKQQAASISPEVIQMLLRHVTTVKN